MAAKKHKKGKGTGKPEKFTLRNGLIAAFLLLLLILMWLFREYLFLIVLIGINVFTSTMLKFLRRNQIGVEMVMFSTVMSGVIYGPAVGAVMGALSMLVDYVFATRISLFAVVTIPSYALVGYFAPFLFNFMNITTLGIIMTIAYVIFSNSIIVGFMGGHLNKSLRFGITDIAFNAVIFMTIAPFVLKMLL
jgi:hypothetical protein